MAAAAVTGVPRLITWAPLGKTHSSATPFGCKVEIALRMAGIDYTVAPGDPTDSKVFVKQKVCPHLPLQHYKALPNLTDTFEPERCMEVYYWMPNGYSSCTCNYLMLFTCLMYRCIDCGKCFGCEAVS